MTGNREGGRGKGEIVGGACGRTIRALSFLLPLSALLIQCATPVAPTGGPVDQTPPRLVASSPEGDAVNVTGRTVRLTFSERIDAATALRAVTVTPESGPGEPVPQVSAAGDELVVELPALRDSTTYVVTVGTELADRRGVRLPAPVTLAFSSGPELDRGELAGTVRLPTDGAGVAGLAVFAYRVTGDSLPDPRTDRPDARTETGADGRFTLGYLADTPHFVAALRDLNRNGRADDGEPFAAPPRPRLVPTAPGAAPLAPAPTGAPDSSGAPTVDPQVQTGPAPRRPGGIDLWLARRDTIPPTVRAARALSDRRAELRFSEGITFAGGPAPRRDGVFYARPADGAADDIGVTYHLDPERPNVLVAWLDASASAGDSLGFTPEAVVDSAGVPFQPGRPVTVVVPAQADTARTRLLGLDRPARADSALLVRRRGFSGQDVPSLRLSGPSAVPLTFVAERSPESGGGLDTLTANGYRLPLSYSVETGGDPVTETVYAYRSVRGPLPDTAQIVRIVQPGRDALGGLVAQPPTALPDSLLWWMEASPLDGGPAAAVTYSPQRGAFELTGLLPGRYRIRFGAYDPRDRPRLADLSRPTWSGGSLVPYRPPEPLLILTEPVEVRARWETEIDAARFAPLFDAPPPDAPAPTPDR